LPIHMIGEVSWEPKKTIVSLSVLYLIDNEKIIVSLSLQVNHLIHEHFHYGTYFRPIMPFMRVCYIRVLLADI
jgi:hypothetical protein